MANLERVYNVPLRREYMKAPRHKRTPKAIRALRAFLAKHMKSDNIILGNQLNQLIWRDGIKNPPHHVKLTAVKDDTGKVTAELVGVPLPGMKEEKKGKKEAKGKKETPVKPAETKKPTEEKAPEKAPEPKKETKETPDKESEKEVKPVEKEVTPPKEEKPVSKGI